MSKVKIFVIAVVIFFSSLMLLYLLYFARVYDKFTSVAYYNKQVVIFSSGDGKLSGNEMLYNKYDEMSKMLHQSNVNIVFLKDNKKVLEYVNNVKDKNQIVLIDINSSKLVVNKNTVLLRIPPDDTNELSDISGVKADVKKQSINMNILNYRKQDNPYNVLLLKVDVSDRCNIKEAEDVLAETLESLISKIK